MKNGEIVISEAKVSTSLLLASLPLALAALVIILMLCGQGLESGIYYRSFGLSVYIVFFGGLTYAFYEFVNVVLKRAGYLPIEVDIFISLRIPR